MKWRIIKQFFCWLLFCHCCKVPAAVVLIIVSKRKNAIRHLHDCYCYSACMQHYVFIVFKTAASTLSHSQWLTRHPSSLTMYYVMLMQVCNEACETPEPEQRRIIDLNTTLPFPRTLLWNIPTEKYWPTLLLQWCETVMNDGWFRFPYCTFRTMMPTTQQNKQGCISEYLKKILCLQACSKVSYKCTFPPSLTRIKSSLFSCCSCSLKGVKLLKQATHHIIHTYPTSLSVCDVGSRNNI